ncbi:hypothetical protein FQA47_022529 [Oryzias melastigma]|uniref:Uncharacterized protein n=1 Tax=Oryzias melastigma TaxID=30732 RepID=A0A834CKS8_ORYME|nr:hypothetical protein FQA47_022529 [Oryzias melastigma]
MLNIVKARVILPSIGLTDRWVLFAARMSVDGLQECQESLPVILSICGEKTPAGKGQRTAVTETTRRWRQRDRNLSSHDGNNEFFFSQVIWPQLQTKHSFVH